MKTGGSRITIVIVLAAAGLVIAPILVRGFPKEVARWHLAAAANSISAKNEAAAQRSLLKASEWNASITEDVNYWLLRVIQASTEGQKKQLEALKEAVEHFPRLRRVGKDIADQQAEEGDFKGALEFAKFALGDQPPVEADDLNQIAYYRALAGVELDQALEEINQALDLVPAEPSLVDARAALLDTRAWVLYQMGKLTEALVDADSAVNAMADGFKMLSQRDIRSSASAEANTSNGNSVTKDSATAISDVVPKAIDKTLLTRRTAGSELWGFGAVRFHRAKILESLGRESDAAADFQWLKDQNLPLDGRLY